MGLGRRALGAAVLVIAAACTPPTPPEEPTLAETLGLPSDTPLLDVACAQVAGVCTSSIQAQVDAVPAGTTAIVRVAAGQYSESVRISRTPRFGGSRFATSRPWITITSAAPFVRRARRGWCSRT